MAFLVISGSKLPFMSDINLFVSNGYNWPMSWGISDTSERYRRAGISRSSGRSFSLRLGVPVWIRTRPALQGPLYQVQHSILVPVCKVRRFSLSCGSRADLSFNRLKAVFLQALSGRNDRISYSMGVNEGYY